MIILKPQTLFSIDINKCRKNILYSGEFDYCVFTVFDSVDEFNSTKIQPGLYYVESDNYMPLRGNVWYQGLILLVSRSFKSLFFVVVNIHLVLILNHHQYF